MTNAHTPDFGLQDRARLRERFYGAAHSVLARP
ncbi:isopropylmalate isomerase [Cribrihabitans marinus]|nr:isopropylmalate isomerase [Cribrihabitans marinus]